MLSAFGKLAGTSAAVDAYFANEIGPLVEHGVLPPVLDGARKFVDANREQMAKIDAEAKIGEVSPFDSHPPLPERIAAVNRLTGKVPELVGEGNAQPALSLLRFPEKVVRDLIVERVGRPLQRVEWNEVAPHFVNGLHYALHDHRRWLETRSVADLDRSYDTARMLAQQVPQISEFAHELEVATLVRLQAQIYTAAPSVALEHVGYEAHTAPGEPLQFRHRDSVIDPSSVVRSYLSGELGETAWQATWEAAGLHDRPWSAIGWRQPPA